MEHREVEWSDTPQGSLGHTGYKAHPDTVAHRERKKKIEINKWKQKINRSSVIMLSLIPKSDV